MKDRERRLLMASRPLIVATYNIRGWGKEEHDGINSWENRKELTLDVIERLSADILGLQEFSKKDNYEFYRKNLPRHKILLGDPVNNGWSNPIIYDPKRLKLLESHTIWLNHEDKPEPDWEADEIRSARQI